MFNFKHVFWSSSWSNKESYDLRFVSWYGLICRPKVFCKKGVLQNIMQNSEENNCVGVSFSTKLQADYCRKEIAAHVFSYKICEIFKNIFLKEHLRMTVLDMKFFKQFFTHIPETFGTFRERFVFAIISLFLLLVPGFRKQWSQDMLINLVIGRNSDYTDNIKKIKH